MENAADALIMAFGVLVFVMALSISISLFGQARDAADTIFSAVETENQYIYIDYLDNENNPKSIRTVGIDTVISSIYRAYRENYKIVFLKKDGSNYSEYNIYISNLKGNAINVIDLEDERSRMIKGKTTSYGAESWTSDIVNNSHYKFLEYLIGGKNGKDEQNNFFVYIYENGLYNQLKDKTISEYLGEYYIEDVEINDSNTTNANKNKKRIITYVIE